MDNLLPVREAQAIILAGFKPVDSESLPFTESLDRVLAIDLKAPVGYPVFNNSAMDGFAVRSSDLREASEDHPVRLKVIGDIPAGVDRPFQAQAGQAVRIMTGAVVPSSVDAVIPIEQVSLGPVNGDNYPDYIDVSAAVKAGQFIRKIGEDVRLDQTLLEHGQRITPAALGMLAVFGLTRLSVYRKPRVAILSSGDELIHPDEPLIPGKIRDANSYVLRSLVARDRCDVVFIGLARDTRAYVQEQFDLAVESKPDIILTSAGVSVGAYDYIRAVVQEHGKLNLWRVNMRPGKPVAFGEYRGIPLFGLPGNPVSTYIGYLVFVRPVLERLAGLKESGRNLLPVILPEAIESDGRETYMRASVTAENGKTIVRLIENQSSGNLLSIVQSNALLIVPSGVKSLPAGSTLDAWLLSDNR